MAIDNINANPSEKVINTKNATGKNNSTIEIFTPINKVIIKRHTVLNRESISVEIIIDMINNCFGKYIFLNKDSFVINAIHPWLNEVEKIDQGIIPENKKIA
ncbi:hypothetical protein QE177_15435 (plasmid) [Arsenophonus sp. aPb]|uniref:hypothetical protein n=1 Tax=Arsenophonus sp. aPb TaxID=3041619 RepID=UPI002468EC32|nr:hypothetical protein [Arsenophonus sp. aPb]WGL99908.1 hypothetical protein QE177_15435 [Arsenophonus sp. aPb]